MLPIKCYLLTAFPPKERRTGAGVEGDGQEGNSEVFENFQRDIR